MANIIRNTDQRFFEKVSNFPTNVYKIQDRNSIIFKLLYALLENGVGQLKGIQDLANQSQQSLASTESGELDKFFQTFGIKRDPKLVYNGSLFEENSVENIQQYKALDAKFRVTIAKVLQSLQKGGTIEGIRLMAEAASSYPVQVLEPWQNYSGYARLASENETVVLILVDKELSADEKLSIKTRVIESLEMIRPVGALITVEVVVPQNPTDNEIIPDYATAGNFAFLSDGNNQYVELLSQEKEIEINSFIVEANPFSVDTEYSTLIGTLEANGDFNTSLLVKESRSPEMPVFFIALSDNTNEEIALVYNRFLFEKNNETFYVYEVVRSRLGTKQIDWNTKTNVKILMNLTKIEDAASEDDVDASTMIPIPDADSPDNYPDGKFEGDPTKYDEEGKYIHEWSSQAEFEQWFKQQVESSGGEVSEGFYTMPRVITLSKKQTLLSAIGSTFKIIRPIIIPRKFRDF